MKTVRFEDLSEEVKKKIIDAQADENQSEVDFECIFEGLINKGKEIGFDIELKNITYSGFYSQGDGLSFTCFVDTKKFIENADHDLVKEEQLAKLEKYKEFGVGTIKIVRNYGNYVHEKSCSVEATDKLFELYCAVERKRYQLSVETYTDMKDHFEGVGSRDYVCEQLSDLGYWYSLDGLQCFQEKPIVYGFDFNDVMTEARKRNISFYDMRSLIDKLGHVNIVRNILDGLPDIEEYAPIFISGLDELIDHQYELNKLLPGYFVGEKAIKDSISYPFADSIVEETYIESLCYSTKDAKDVIFEINEYMNNTYDDIDYDISDDSSDVFSITFSVDNIFDYMSCLDIMKIIDSKFKTVDAPEPKMIKSAAPKALTSADILSDAELNILRTWLEDDDDAHDQYEQDRYFENNSYGALEIVAEVIDRFKTCLDESEEKLFSKIQMIYAWTKHD